MVCPIFYDKDVVCLRAGGGHAGYLALDGTVYYENYGEGKQTEVVDDPRGIASMIVKCADDIGLPELIDLLPARPLAAFVCGLCNGTRRESPTGGRRMDMDDKPWCCRRCDGLGWTAG